MLALLTLTIHCLWATASRFLIFGTKAAMQVTFNGIHDFNSPPFTTYKEMFRSREPISLRHRGGANAQATPRDQ